MNYVTGRNYGNNYYSTGAVFTLGSYQPTITYEAPDTKHCQYCHKERGENDTMCNQCGHIFDFWK